LSKLPKLKPMVGDWRLEGVAAGWSSLSLSLCLPFSLYLLPLQRVSCLRVLLTAVVWMQQANEKDALELKL